MGDVDFKVFVGVSFTSVTLQCEGFPLGGEGGVGDEIGERVKTSGLVGWGWVRGYGMVDKSGKGGGEVVRVVGWDMSSM